MSWRTTLPELLSGGDYRTQAQIVGALEGLGVSVDQSVVSRELRRLGAMKVDGIYRLPPPPSLGVRVHAMNIAHGGGIAVLRTEPAFASVVAQAVDDAAVPGVLGSIAGDDTVMVAFSEPDAITELRHVLGLSAIS